MSLFAKIMDKAIIIIVLATMNLVPLLFDFVNVLADDIEEPQAEDQIIEEIDEEKTEFEVESEEANEIEIELPQYADIVCNHQGECLPVGITVTLFARTIHTDLKYSIQWEATPDGGTTIYKLGTGNEFSFILDEENVNWLWRAVIVYEEIEVCLDDGIN